MRTCTKAQLSEAAKNSLSVLGVIRYLGISYCTNKSSVWRLVRAQLDQHGVNTTHFKGKGSSKSRQSPKRKNAKAVLVLRRNSYREKGGILRRALIESGVPYQCEICGTLPQWNTKPLCLQVDHKNGSWRDCRITNLRFLCPNCHSQEETSIRHKTYVRIICPKCGVLFNSRVNKLGVTTTTFCSSTCGILSYSSPPSKVSWPTQSKLKLLVWSKPVYLVAKELGISGSAVKKRCSKFGITTPPRGYWTRRGYAKD